MTSYRNNSEESRNSILKKDIKTIQRFKLKVIFAIENLLMFNQSIFNYVRKKFNCSYR